MKIKQKKHLLYKNTVSRVNKIVITTSSFVLALVFFVILLPTDSYAVISSRADCQSVGGTWNADIDGGICYNIPESADNPFVDTMVECQAAGGTWNADVDGGICQNVPETGVATPPNSSGTTGTTNPAGPGGWLSCDGVRTSIISCADGDGSTPEQSGIYIMLKLAIQVMAAGVGILAVAGIVWGSVLYASAGGAQEQVKKATTIIRNTVFGLLIFVFMFAIINFLIPGGILT